MTTALTHPTTQQELQGQSKKYEEVPNSKAGNIFHPNSPTINYGDWVVLYATPQVNSTLQVSEGGVFHSKHGQFLHSDIVGKAWGQGVTAKRGAKAKQRAESAACMYLLRPTPELWTLNLPHRTQILYTADISFILSRLDISPGDVVVESGTGSGSMTHALARIVGPTGHVHTFEFHAERAAKAAEEFTAHGLSPSPITIRCRDVCADGFAGLTGVATAVFLDLPKPWQAIAAAKQALNPERVGRICCFSPCIQQVHESCTALNQHGFTDIQMFEVLVKGSEVRTFVPKPFPLSSDSTTASEPVKEDDPIQNDPSEKGDASPGPTKKRRRRGDVTLKLKEPEEPIPFTAYPAEVRGHTSYLTFATLFPQSVRLSAPSQSLDADDADDQDDDQAPKDIDIANKD